MPWECPETPFGALSARKSPVHQDLRDVSFDGYYDRGAAFAGVWRAGQTDRVNSASTRTNWIFVVSNFECSYLGLFKLNETAQSVLALTKLVSLFVFRLTFCPYPDATTSNHLRPFRLNSFYCVFGIRCGTDSADMFPRDNYRMRKI